MAWLVNSPISLLLRSEKVCARGQRYPDGYKVGQGRNPLSIYLHLNENTLRVNFVLVV